MLKWIIFKDQPPSHFDAEISFRNRQIPTGHLADPLTSVFLLFVFVLTENKNIPYDYLFICHYEDSHYKL
jgi:hypothetical protein